VAGNIAMQKAAITFTPKMGFYLNRFPTMGAKKFTNLFEIKLRRAWDSNNIRLKKTNMEKLIIQIGASSDHFGGFAINIDGINGAGNTVEECKANLLEGLKLMIKNSEKSYFKAPQWLVDGDYELEYRYDTQSILSHYADVFSKPALEKLTGINQKQLHHYATGLKKPREGQRKKIETALHLLGTELLAVRL
jgi:uncharacterized protein YneR